MKREIRREARLVPFSIRIADLELLWNRVESLLPEPEASSIYVDIEFGEEKLTLDSKEELLTTKYPKSRSTNFTLHCHDTTQSLHLYTPPHSGTRAKLVVTSDSELWAAGAREAVLTFVNQNRAWHYWLSPGLLFAFLLSILLNVVLTLVFTLAAKSEGVFPQDKFLLIFGSVVMTGLLGFVATNGRNFLPPATLRLTEQEPFWRKYVVELTLLLALVSAVLSAYSAFVPKG